MLKKVLAIIIMVIGLGLATLCVTALLNNQVYVAIIFGLAGIAFITAGSLLFQTQKSLHDFF